MKLCENRGNCCRFDNAKGLMKNWNCSYESLIRSNEKGTTGAKCFVTITPHWLLAIILPPSQAHNHLKLTKVTWGSDSCSDTNTSATQKACWQVISATWKEFSFQFLFVSNPLLNSCTWTSVLVFLVHKYLWFGLSLLLNSFPLEIPILHCVFRTSEGFAFIFFCLPCHLVCSLVCDTDGDYVIILLKGALTHLQSCCTSSSSTGIRPTSLMLH